MPDEYVRVANGVMHLTNLGPYGREAINRMRRDGWLRAGRTSREYVCTDGPTPAVSAESTSGSPRRIGF